MNEGDQVRLEDVLDLGVDEVPLGPLLDAVTRSDVLIGVFTDEELAWTAPDPEVRRDNGLDEPRLSELDDEQRDVALASAMWSLIARGAASWDGDELRLHGVLSVLADLRFAPEAAVSVRSETREAGPGARATAIYRTRPDLFVVEQVAPEGLHRLIACSAERATIHLAGMLDPLGRASSSAHVATVARREDLRPTPEELAASADSAAVAVSADAGGARRSVTAYGDAEGLWALHGIEEPGGVGEVTLQRLSPADLVTYADAFLAPTTVDAVDGGAP